MSVTITPKRALQDPSKVSAIKIRKLENENYRIESNDSIDENYGQNYDQSYEENGVFEPETYMQQNMYDQNVKTEPMLDDDGDLVCTPSFDAFDSIINQSQDGEDESFNLPSELKIDSITSLNPSFDNEYENGDGEQNISNTFKGKKRRPIRHLVYIFAEDGNRYFPCHCCTSAFIKKYLLIKHIVAKHKDMIVCKLCACIFLPQMKESYQQHMKAHNTRLPTQTKQCPLCLFWLTPKSYQGHLSNHNLLQKHICRQCKQEFPTFYIRARHVCPMRN